MIYVLIALALFGALTLTLSSQNEQADGQDLSDEQAEFYASELIEYVASTKNIIDQMIATGTDIDELDFINPASAGFDTPPHIHKLYHPQGGGLNYKFEFSQALQVNGNSGWYLGDHIDTEWTPSTLNDVVISAVDIPISICENINKKITGTSDIPELTTGSLYAYAISAAPVYFETSDCAECVGMPSLCVQDNGVETYGFYNIIAAR